MPASFLRIATSLRESDSREHCVQARGVSIGLIVPQEMRGRLYQQLFKKGIEHSAVRINGPYPVT